MPVREARLADAPAIARVHVDAWRESYRGIVPAATLAGLRYEEFEARRVDALTHGESGERRFTLVFEAADGALSGFAGGGPNRGDEAAFDAELYAIYLLDSQKGRGAGRALVRALADCLAGAGFRSLIVWVFRDNPRARRFYEVLGGTLGAEKSFEIGGAPLVEVAYGWPDLRVLTA